jgi:hypothetical protein
MSFPLKKRMDFVLSTVHLLALPIFVDLVPQSSPIT